MSKGAFGWDGRFVSKAAVGAAVLLSLGLLASPAAVAGDFKAGKRVFNKCRACHAIGTKVRKMQGPHLNGVVGRAWGAVEDYKYSDGRDGTLLAIHAAEPRVWDIETLSAYLRQPKDVVPKGKMAFAGLGDDQDILDVLFYIASFDDEGNETDPEPVLAAAAGDGDEDAADEGAAAADEDATDGDAAEEEPAGD